MLTLEVNIWAKIILIEAAVIKARAPSILVRQAKAIAAVTQEPADPAARTWAVKRKLMTNASAVARPEV